MLKRLSWWPIADVLVIDDPLQMATLNAHAHVSRYVLDEGGWINRLVHRWIYGTFTIGRAPLGVFTAHEDEARITRQEALERRLKQTEPAADGIGALARYVAGVEGPDEIGVVAQQVIGRLFFTDYVASAETYRAARRLMHPIWIAWAVLTGRRPPGTDALIARARHDLDCVHATGIAVHGLVDTLARMRRLAKKRHRGRTPNADAAVLHTLVAPSLLLRSCTKDTIVPFLDEPLRRGTLIVFRLRAMYEAARTTDLAFSRDAWSRCPAHELVPRLLLAVWREAKHVPTYGPRRRSWISRLFTGTFTMINRVVPCHRLPTWAGVANLAALRTMLREKNLYDTETPHSRAGRCPVTGWLARYEHERTPDGTYNDLAEPRMGAAHTRFGRAVPLDRTVPETPATLLRPNPRRISNELLARRNGRMIEAQSLNLLAAGWVQFEIHDWFSHGRPDTANPHTLELAADDPWPERPMQIGRTPAEEVDDPPLPSPTYRNHVTHWWDASQLYGSDPDTVRQVRAHRDGKLATVHGLLPCHPETRIPITGFSDNWWVGLALFHQLFTLEHNAICDRLRIDRPHWDDEQLFATARLINAALIAKIHTLEWTPAMLGHPATRIGMKGNWWGLAGERIHRLLGRVTDSEVWSGIPGSATDHHAAPYAMPEEFVSVYRMHPLLPDRLVVRSATTGQERERYTLLDVTGAGAQAVLETTPMADLFYSFGMAHPGQITLGNYPDTLRQFRRADDNALLDVAAIDVLRDRERGVPRYNDFRALFHMPRVTSFEALNPAWARALREVYEDQIDRVDLMVGMLAETPPHGFAFSDTAFRILILMASRRLKSDRFFTSDYTADVYTQTGLDWIETNDLRSVLTRHYPGLRPALLGVENAFAPWHAID